MLTQNEAEALLAIEKVFRDPGQTLPVNPGCRYQADVESTDGTERFILDVSRKRVKFSFKNQLRGRAVVVLARLCIDAGPHRNPDNEVIAGTHVHLYREGDDALWAYEVDSQIFTDLSDPTKTLAEFCDFVNIKLAGTIANGLALGGAA